MPARHDRFRKLKSEFKDFIDKRGSWPRGKTILGVLDSEGGGTWPSIKQLREGNSVPEKYVLALAKLLKSDIIHFAKFKNMPNWDFDDLYENVNFIADPVTARCDSTTVYVDWFDRGIDSINEVFGQFIQSRMFVDGMRCKSEKDVAKAVDMILFTLGRHIKSDSDLEFSEAIKLAESIMGISRDTYLRQMVSWWENARDCILFSVVDRRRVGCSVILPVTDSAYFCARQGQLITLGISPEAIQSPSGSLIFHALAELPPCDYPDISRRTKQQFRTIMLHAALLIPKIQSWDDSFRAIAFGGTPENHKRLRKTGFRLLGIKDRHHNLDIFEFDEKTAGILKLVIKQMSRDVFR